MTKSDPQPIGTPSPAPLKSTKPWWSSRIVVRHVSTRLCGKPVRGPGEAIRLWAEHLLGSRRPATGVSIGCGAGEKEIALIEQGFVAQMDCFDLSETRIARARASALAKGLGEHIRFHCEDGLNGVASYDLVYWNNALHQMPDVRAAVRWSRAALNPGGLFLLEDYVGPNRLQISRAELRLVNAIKADLPLAWSSKPVTLKQLAQNVGTDPPEAVDSAVTLAALRETFPDIQIRPLGGLVYFIALGGLYARMNLEDDTERALLLALLRLDAMSADESSTLYAAAAAFV